MDYFTLLLRFVAKKEHLQRSKKNSRFQRSTQEYKDASEFWELCERTKNELLEEEDEPPPKPKYPRLGRPVSIKSFSETIRLNSNSILLNACYFISPRK